MLIKSSAIDRLLRENTSRGKRSFWLSDIGLRIDKEKFNLGFQDIVNAIDLCFRKSY